MKPSCIQQASFTHSQRKSQRRKTFTGCWDCRSRKVKCDEATPECTPCRRRGFPCSGYEPVLVWITPNKKEYEAGRRRMLKSYSTWRGHQIYDSASVDGLIAKCDASNRDDAYRGISAGPFTVFASRSIRVPSPRRLPSDIIGILDEGHDAQLKYHAGFLFHHYSTYIAKNMMPFEDRRNPWRSFYPLMARCGTSRGHRALLHAMLAQAAGNLAYLGSDVELMSILTVKHYALAIENLRRGLEDDWKDFSVVLASVLTLIMAEVYNGKTKAWRTHLNGAWDFISSHQGDQPWHQSEDAWLTAQSLCLLKIRSDTMRMPNKTLYGNQNSDSANYLVSSIAARTDFGFTVGASPALMSCIIETTHLASKVSHNYRGTYPESISLYDRLRACSFPCTSHAENFVRLHHRIFQLGAIIYFHRAIFNSHPQALMPYLDEILLLLKEYRDLSGGYVTLWPVFMAAVEAYQECHQAGFRDWLDDCEKMGAASRKGIREAIESVWRERDEIRALIGCVDPGEIVVDWMDVTFERGFDILLV